MIEKDITERIYKEANDAWLMQVATSEDNRPWIANVFFVVDNKLSFYWLSYPNRRHSRELVKNNYAAVAITIKADKPVIGIQAEGKVEQVHSYTTLAKILPSYVIKYGQGKNFLKLAKQGKNKHIVYKFTPESLQMFDEVHYTPEQNPIQLFFEP